MFFLNLTTGEFLTLLTALGGLITALYLLDRSRSKKVVSTLRFWVPATDAPQARSRKRVREPWSLLLQLVSLMLLLLAIAQLQWGSRAGRGHDHVILLDTSSWTAEQNSQGTVLDSEKSAAQQYLAALPARDRAMLVRADALSAPGTPFTADRRQLLRALNESIPAFSALNISQALSFAQQARSWSGGEPGEIVYIGPKLVENTLENGAEAPKLERLRIIYVPVSRENSGIRTIAVKRGDDEANSWQATVTLKNYGSEPRSVHLRAQFAGTVFAPRELTLRAGQESAAQYTFVTNTAGRFAAAIEPHDRLLADDQASLELPGSGLLKIAAFTSRPEALRPLFESNHRLSVKFIPLADYVSKPVADVMLLDQFAPPEQTSARQASAANEPQLPSLWIEPPRGASPLPINSVVSDAVIKTWRSDAALGMVGLHAREARIPRAEVFQTFEGDQPLGSIAEGPVIVLRPPKDARRKQAVIGFDPLSGGMRFEVTTPLLFANLLRWLSPDAFRSLEITAGRIGAATIALEKGENPANVRVTDERGFVLPFTARSQTLELFASRPGVVHVLSDDRNRVLSLTLPDIAELEWKPVQTLPAGVPAPRSFPSTAIDLWQVLALLGGLGLLSEWLLFGRRRAFRGRTVPRPVARPAGSGHHSATADKEQLVGK